MEYLLSTDCLTKKFKRQTAIDNISLHIRQGEIYGLIGKNGAGKTTFLKMISGLSKPTSGDITFFGYHGAERNKVISRIGVLIEAPGLYQQTPSAMETLRETGDEVNWGIYIGQVSPEWCTGAKIPLPELVSMNIQSKLLLMFLVAFIALFAGNEIRTGFIKNIAGQTRHRWEFVIGKLLSIAIFTAVLLVAAILAIMAGSVLFFGYVHIQEAGKFIGYLGMQYLLHIAYGSVILFLVYLFQNVVASLLTGILLAAGILQVVDALLINIIPRLKEIADFSIMNYLSSGNVGLLSMASGGSLYLKALLIAIITLILMGSLSGLMMQKKDI